jgi:hypothetical protein
MKQGKFEELMRQQEKSVLQRRKQLAELYNDEMESWTQEILSNVETIEDKKNKIKERAYALRDARENERKKYIELCKDRQFKDSVDEIRNVKNLDKILEVNNFVLSQIAEKIQRKVKLSELENEHVKQWKLARDDDEKLDKMKDDARKAASEKLVQGLKMQIQEIQHRREYENYSKRKEGEEEIARIRDALAKEEIIQKRRQEENRKRGEEAFQFNSLNKVIKEEERLIEKDQEKLLLNYALYQESKQLQAELDNKNKHKKIAEDYREYLKEQMIHEANDNSLVDQMRKMEEEKVWKARDDQLQAREDARRNLIKTVINDRQEQLEHKNQIKYAEMKEEAEWASKVLHDANIGLSNEKRQALERKNIAAQNQIMVAEQIRKREEQAILEKQEEFLADKLAKRNARLQTERIQQISKNLYK